MNRNDTQFMAQKIRTQYIEKEHTELDELRTLDKRVKRPASIFSYVFGSIGAIVMGTGMSLIMTTLGDALGVFEIVLGVFLGLAGGALVALAYPTYSYVIRREREKIAPEMLRLTDELMK